jgi:hypothetical protein
MTTIILALVWPLLLHHGLGQHAFSYQSPAVCSVYDPASLICDTCPANAVPKADGSGCICVPGYRQTTTKTCDDCIALGMVITMLAGI